MKHTLALTALAAVVLSSTLARAQAPEEAPPITKLPALKASSEAVFPDAALRARVEGRVVLAIDIDDAGRVTGASVVESSTVARGLPVTVSSTVADPFGFEAAALLAAQALEFTPAEANGQPVPVQINYTFNFALPPMPEVAGAGTSTTGGPALPGIVNFRGVIRERGTRTRVPGAVVTVFRGEAENTKGFEATSDAQGEFEFRDLEPGPWRVLAEADGYFPFRTEETIVVGEAVEATYYVEKSSYSPYDVVVEASRPKKEVSRRTLSKAEVVKVPGTLGDPILAVENLPGVARSQPGTIIVRGSGPEDTDVYVDGISVPLIYHFGGLRSVLPAELLESIDFFPGNYAVDFGRALGGVLDARSIRPKLDQVHGSIDVSLLDASLFLQVPLGEKFSVSVAGRRSYIDFILEAVIPDDSSVALISAPRYYDYQVLASYRPAEGHEARLFFFGSDDVFKLLFENPGEIDPQLRSGRLDTGTNFVRLLGDYEFTSGDFRNVFRASVGEDAINFQLGNQFRFNLDFITVQVRESLRYQVSKAFSLTGGIDYIFQRANLSIRAPRPPKEGGGGQMPDVEDVIAAEIVDLDNNVIAPFIQAEINIGERLQLFPGARVDYFQIVDAVSFDPRIVARYTLDDQWVVKGGVGLVHQEPTPDETDASFGNPDLGLERALHISAGAEYKPFSFLSLDATFFYKGLDNLVSPTDASRTVNGQVVPAIYDNGGKGLVYGMELYVRHEFSNNLRGWITYTLSRATRRDSGQTEDRIFDFDQTHIFALVASYVFPENWEFGARWRVVSGNPRTPVVAGVFLADEGKYQSITGLVNSARLPLFHQLDLRLDKRWVWDAWSLSAYISLINSYNRANIEGLTYNYDFTQSKGQQGLPILPILGIKADF